MDPVDRARELFLTEDNPYGCAETTLVVLQELFGLPNPTDSSAAMALNGGVAYSGAMCGAITGAAMALGRLAAERIDDHADAKQAAREATQRLMAEFEAEFGGVSCRYLSGYDLLAEHDAFIDSEVWTDVCMRQIEFAVTHVPSFVSNPPENRVDSTHAT